MWQVARRLVARFQESSSKIVRLSKRWLLPFTWQRAGMVSVVVALLLTVPTLLIVTNSGSNSQSEKTPKTAAQEPAKQTGAPQGDVASATTTDGQPAGQPGGAGTGTGGAPANAPKRAESPLYGPGGPKAGSLKFSPASVALPKNGYATTVEVYTAGDAKLYLPTISTSYMGSAVMIWFDTSDTSPTPTGGTITKTRWKLNFRQTNLSSSGQEYLTVKAWGTGGTYEGKVLVSWSASPSFYVTKGALDRVDTAEATTWTMHFTLVPNAYFGNPTIIMRVYDKYAGTGLDYCDGGIRSKTVQYNGQNEQTLTCIENKLPPYVPGSGPPPPLPSNFALQLSVSGMVNGEYINGGTGLSDISYEILH